MKSRSWTCLALGIALGFSGCGGAEDPETGEPVGGERGAPPITGRPVTPPPGPPQRFETPPAPAPEPVVREAPPLSAEERAELGFPERIELPEDAVPSELARDVPLPRGASAISEPMRTPEGFTHGMYAVEGSASAAQTEFTAGLLAQGWSIEPAGGNASDKALVTATKGNRQLVVAIETIEGRTQLVLVEMEAPNP